MMGCSYPLVSCHYLSGSKGHADVEGFCGMVCIRKSLSYSFF